METQESAVARVRQRLFTPLVLGIAGLVVVLTAAFVGLLALISNAALDVGSRLPAYALTMGVVFVVTVVRLDTPERDGAKVLTATAGISAVSFVVVALATEGVVYAASQPQKVITSQLVLYFAAAAMVCAGVLIWAIHHWREFATDKPGGL